MWFSRVMIYLEVSSAVFSGVFHCRWQPFVCVVVSMERSFLLCSWAWELSWEFHYMVRLPMWGIYDLFLPCIQHTLVYRGVLNCWPPASKQSLLLLKVFLEALELLSWNINSIPKLYILICPYFHPLLALVYMSAVAIWILTYAVS